MVRSSSLEPTIPLMSVVTSEHTSAAAPAPVLTDTGLGPWENSADPAYCRDMSGRLLAANLSFARKFGRPAHTLPGTSVAEFIHPDDFSSTVAIAAELERPPHRVVCEHRWLTPQGIRWFSWE
jgi:PAS domain-containing protein